MKFGVKVMPREVILDTQGRAVEQSLRLNQKAIQSCRVGKFIELEIATQDENEGRKQAEEIAKLLLHNPLIEQYEITRL